MIKLADYNILKKIGSGGMGDVYLAKHKVLENIVAIKSLHQNLVKDEVFRKRFKSEAKIHSKLHHSNIVKLIDFQERKDGLFIIMEYVEGQQLDGYIKNVTGPIAEKELITLFLQIVNAISYAHSKGLVHRDIKPANIIISAGSIKVLDFGIAKNLSTESGLTKTGVQVGTPMYMSPEQVNAESLDKLTDIYSLGVTLFYMAVGNPPYEHSNAMKMGIKIVTEPFPEAKNYYPGVSEKIEIIIKKATQKKKSDRYQSCDDLIKDLKSDNLVVSKITKKNDKTPSVKLEKNKNSTSVTIVILLLIFGGLIGYYSNYQNKLEMLNEYETKKETINKEKESIYISNPDRVNKEKMEREYELKRKAEKKRRAEEQRKIAEENRLAEEQRKIAEENRLAEQKRRIAEENRLAEQKRRIAEENRLAEEKRVEEARIVKKNKKNTKRRSISKPSIPAKTFFKTAEAMRNDNNYNDAIETYTKAINADPNYLEAYYKRGVSFVKIGNYQAAFDDFTKNINLNSNNSNVYRDRAVLKRLMGNQDYCDDYKMACDLGNMRSCSDYESCK
tara:strand:- start:696 stop:2372 length:1677 start_codon:yes stop_codon:yes gene_type:complete